MPKITKKSPVKTKTRTKAKRTTKAAVKATPRKTAPKPKVQPVVVTPVVTKAKIFNTPTIIGIVVIVLVGLAYLLRGSYLAAIVNGQPVSRLKIMKQAEKAQGQQLLEQEVLQTLIVQKAREEGIEVSDVVIQTQIEDIKQSVVEQGQDFDQLLALQGMTLEDLEFQIKLNQIIEQLLGSDAQVTEAEIAQFLEENKDYLPADQTEEELQALAQEQLKQQKMSEQYQAWVDELKRNAKINYFAGYAPKEVPELTAPETNSAPADATEVEPVSAE